MADQTNNLKVRIGVEGVQAVGGALNSLAANLTGLYGRLTALSAALGSAGLSVERIVHHTRAAINTADAMGKMAEKTGIAVEALSRLTYAAKINDVEQGELQQALKNLAGEMVKAGRGAIPLEEELLRIADQFRLMPDGAAKSQRAVELFGRAGLSMIPFLNQGSGAINELMTEADALGLTVGSEFASQADQFNDNVTRMQESARGLWMVLANQLLPDLTRISDELVRMNRETGNLRSLGGVLGTVGRVWMNAANESLASWEELVKRMTLWPYAVKRLYDAAAGMAARDFVGGIEKQLKAMLGAAAPTGKPTGPDLEALRKEHQEMLKAQDLKIRGLELEADKLRFKVEQNKQDSEAVAALRMQLKLIDEANEKRRQMVGDAFENNIATGAETQQADIDRNNALFRTMRERSGLIDPNNIGQNLSAHLTALQNQYGTFAQSIAGLTTNTIGTAINGVSTAIMGMIDGTATWGQVFAQVARSIIASIVQTVVQWIAQMTIIRALKAIFHTEENAAAAKSAAAWAPAAVAANTASYGLAGLVGLSATITTMSAGVAAAAGLASAGFAGGGFTGAGGRLEPAGLVHRGEFVFSAPAVRNIGIDALEGLHDAGVSGHGAAPSPAPAPVFKNSFAVVNSHAELKHWLESSEGERVFLDMHRRAVRRYNGREV